MATFRYKIIPLFCLGFFLLLTQKVQASRSIDSLLKVVASTQTDSIKVEAYLTISGNIINSSPDSAFIYAHKALKIAKKNKNVKAQIQAENMIGNCYQRQGKYDKALVTYQHCMKLAEKSKDLRGLAQVTNNIGIVHTNKGEYDKALSIYQESMEYERKLKNKNGVAEALNNIGVIHYYMGNIDQTIKYFSEALVLEEELGNDHMLKKGYINLGAIMDYTKDYDGALKNYNKALNISKKLNDKQEMSICLNNIAGVYQSKGQLEKSEEYYLKSLSIKNDIGDKNGVSTIYFNLGTLEEKWGNTEKAISFYTQSLEISETIDSKFNIREACKNLATIYEKKGNFQTALVYHKKLSAIKDSILNEEKAKVVAEMETKYQTAEKERMLLIEKNRSAELEKENAIKEKNVALEKKKTAEAEEAEAKSKNLAIILGGGVIAIFFLALFIIQKNRRKAQAEKDAILIQEREKGLHAVIDAAESERRRIARDLHDGVGQQLTGIKMALQQLSSADENNQKLEKLTEILDDASKDVRALSHQMMPKMLEEEGLLPAIEDMLKKTLGITPIKYELTTKGMNQRFDKKIELGLYRVAQELIGNILKHSQANEVLADLYLREKNILMMVEDNGVGMPDEIKEGLGLQNMKGRITAIGGTIEFVSEKGKGTSVTINIPI